jgi:hypothetical protein
MGMNVSVLLIDNCIHHAPIGGSSGKAQRRLGWYLVRRLIFLFCGERHTALLTNRIFDKNFHILGLQLLTTPRGFCSSGRHQLWHNFFSRSKHHRGVSGPLQHHNCDNRKMLMVFVW